MNVNTKVKQERHDLREIGAGHRGMAWLMLLLGFLYIRWIFDSVALGAGTTVFTVLFCGAAAGYLAKNGISQTRESLVYLGLVGLSALVFLLVDSPFSVLNLLFLQGMAVYWIAVSTGRRLDGTLSGYILGDGILQLILLPFGNFGREVMAIFSRRVREERNGQGEAGLGSVGQGLAESGKANVGSVVSGGANANAKAKKQHSNLFLALCGIVLVIPVLLIVISLLMSADAAFEELIRQLDLHIRMPENFGVLFWEFCLGIPVACYLFGILYGNVTGRGAERLTKQGLDRCVSGVKIVPPVMACAALGALIAVYVLFFASQAGYLFSAFYDRLPVAMTYADYARRGFFELCAVAAINLAVIAAAMLFTAGTGSGRAGSDHTSKALRVADALLCVLTVLLIGTALSKMGMYIHYYGLTRLRFFTTAFMLLMLIGFLIIFVRQLREFCCGRCLAVLCIAGFLVLSYSNADAWIARYNIARYEAGTLSELDVEMFGELSAGAVRPIYDFYMRTDDPAMKRRICRSLRIGTALPDGDGDWQTVDADALDWQLAGNPFYSGNESLSKRVREWNYQRRQAEKLIVEMGESCLL